MNFGRNVSCQQSVVYSRREDIGGMKMNKEQWHQNSEKQKANVLPTFSSANVNSIIELRTCVKRLLIDLEYRDEPPPSHDAKF
jgi:hypothetical protein